MTPWEMGVPKKGKQGESRTADRSWLPRTFSARQQLMNDATTRNRTGQVRKSRLPQGKRGLGKTAGKCRSGVGRGEEGGGGFQNSERKTFPGLVCFVWRVPFLGL